MFKSKITGDQFKMTLIPELPQVKNGRWFSKRWPKFSVFSILRGRMTNSENEKQYYSAHFDTYVGFQNGVGFQKLSKYILKFCVGVDAHVGGRKSYFKGDRSQFNPCSIRCCISHEIWVMGRPFKTFVRKVVRFHWGPIQADTMVFVTRNWPWISGYFLTDACILFEFWFHKGTYWIIEKL